MPDSMMDMGWPVYGSGYRWALGCKSVPEDDTPAELWLTERVPEERQSGSALYRYYNPFVDEPELYRRFCEIKLTRTGIAEFANEYGLLGAPWLEDFVFATRGETLVVTKGERLHSWKQAQADLAHALALHDAMLDHDEATLNELTYIRDGGKRYSIDEWARYDRNFGELHVNRPVDHLVRMAVDAGSSAAEASLAMARLDPRIQDRLDATNIKNKAWVLLQYMINLNLEALVRTKLLWNARYEHHGLYLVPVSLYGAMWLQLAQHVSTGNVRVCEVCGHHFVHRSSKAQYCSNKCKQKAYRNSKQVEDGSG